MPSESVEEIASEMRAAVSGGPQAVGKVLSTHYAERMHIGHEPALPADGLHQRDAFIAHMESENAAFAASLPDMGYESLIETSGDEITATTTISGTMADGTK